MHRIKLSVLFFVFLSPALFAQSKRPMTFDDMMAMKRLGETAVSPDGKWLAYSVTTVDLEKNLKTPELWLQKIEGGEPMKISVAQPGDSGPQFSHDGKHILLLSSRDGAQQIWLADFDPPTGATSNAKKLTTIATEADNARWSPDGQSIVFTSSVYPDCPAITFDKAEGDKCNADKNKAAAESKVKAQIFTALLYRHWNHFTGPKRSHLFLVQLDSGKIRDLNPGDSHDVPPFSLGGGGGFSISPDSKELAFTENPDPVPATSTSAQIYTLDLTDPAAKPIKISTSAGGNFDPAYSPDGKYIAWRSQARAGYESDKFRLMLYDRSTKTLADLLPKLDNWVDEFAWASDSKNLYFTSGVSGSEPIFSVATNGNNLSWRTGLGVIANDFENGEYSDLHITSDGRYLLAARMTVSKPSEEYVMQLGVDSGMNVDKFGSAIHVRPGSLDSAGYELDKISQLTRLNEAVLERIQTWGGGAHEPEPMESFWFTAKDGT
ncbi:MAG TPA: S9 family peptidase, partial [Terracidiphilus sp.]